MLKKLRDKIFFKFSDLIDFIINSLSSKVIKDLLLKLLNSGKSFIYFVKFKYR